MVAIAFIFYLTHFLKVSFKIGTIITNNGVIQMQITRVPERDSLILTQLKAGRI
jgi:hypothetical protein